MLSIHMLDQIAQTVYEAVRVWDSANDLEDRPTWKKLSAEGQKALVEHIKMVLSDPRAGDATHHNRWVSDMQASGWSKGDVLDEKRKIHPHVVPFSMLPPAIRARERMIRAITISLSHV